MRTVEWIAKNAGKADGRIKQFNSVVKDENGVIYSYGWHYPLLFKVKGLWFVNNAGYSVTTSRHISWAHQAVEYKAYKVIVPGEHRYGIEGAEQVENWLADEMTELILEMSKKKRKNTGVYQNLSYKLAETNRARLALKGAK